MTDDSRLKPTSQEIDVKKIFIAQERKRRKFDENDEDDQYLIKNVQKFGILQPVEVRPVEARFELVFGQRRLAVAKHLGMKTIPAVVRDWTDEQLSLVALAENTMRRQMTPVQYSSHLQKMLQHVEDCFGPDLGRAAGGIVRAQQAMRDPETAKFMAEPRIETSPEAQAEASTARPTKPTDEQQNQGRSHRGIVAEILGVTPRTAGDKIKVARSLTEGQFEAMRDCKATNADLLALANIEQVDARARAVEQIAAGSPVSLAIEAAVAETKAKEELAETGKAVPIMEQELSDADWLMVYCAEIRRWLQDPSTFDADALLYRRDRKERHDHKSRSKDSIRKALDRRPTPSFASLLYNALFVEHPRDWWLCYECNGRNVDYKDCVKCHGRGYTLKFMDRPKKKS